MEASRVTTPAHEPAQVRYDAVHGGLIARSPVSRKTSPMMGKRRHYVATTGQVWALHAVMPPYLQVSVLLGALAGLQVAETCGLRPGDVDLALGIIHPAVEYPAEPLKTEISRTAIPIPYSLSTELLAHQAQFPGPAVVCDPSGQQIGPWRLERAFCAAQEKVPGLPDGFRYRDLRHFFASVLIASGADVKKVQARLRHASAKATLDIYGHLWPDTDESTRAALEAVFTARPDHQGRIQKRAV
jgi:integrase